MSLGIDILLHYLRIFGVTAQPGDRPDELVCSGGDIHIRLVHESAFPAETTHGSAPTLKMSQFRAVLGGDAIWSRLRSMYPARVLEEDILQPVVADTEGRSVWAWVPSASGSTLLIGTDLVRDIVLFRQGDPGETNRPVAAQWGIDGERPTYLFNGLVDADHPQDRMADWWLWTLRDALIRRGYAEPLDILPFNAPGVVIVTGDDDQAYLEDYRAQSKKLGRLPVTYFLHPLTRHDRGSLAEHAQGRIVEWELHPDALESPGEYRQRLAEQCAWFEALTGRRARLVRNHGFLNDGYWGHAESWLEQGIAGSSNLPGLDGRVLNGSLLPARLALGGTLTSHWSLLTAYGDGVFFIYDWDEATAIEKLLASGRRIVESGVPGILLLNLHPANHEKAEAMHEAAHQLVSELGFAAMTFGAALEWFSERDSGRKPRLTTGMLAPFSPTRGTENNSSQLSQTTAGDGINGNGFARRVLRFLLRLVHGGGNA